MQYESAATRPLGPKRNIMHNRCFGTQWQRRARTTLDQRVCTVCSKDHNGKTLGRTIRAGAGPKKRPLFMPVARWDTATHKHIAPDNCVNIIHSNTPHTTTTRNATPRPNTHLATMKAHAHTHTPWQTRCREARRDGLVKIHPECVLGGWTRRAERGIPAALAERSP